MSIEFYISPKGNDRWTGRRAAPDRAGTDGPFATLERAQKAVRKLKKTGELAEPVRVVIRDGVYPLKKPILFTPDDSGSPAPTDGWGRFTGPERGVTYAAYPGETPVFSGGERITGWRTAKLNGRQVWVAHLPDVERGKWFFTQLWVNGRRARRPRLPKQGLFRIAEPLGEVLYEGDIQKMLFTGQDAFRYAGDDLTDWRNLDDIEFVGLHYWIESRINFSGIDTASQTATLKWKSRMRLTDDFGRDGAPYYVENVFEALEEPGQWYLDRPSGRLYYLPLPGETIRNAEVYAPRLAQVMRLEGDPAGARVSHLAFEGLTFSHTEWVPGDEARVATPQAACHIPGAIVVRGASECRFDGCAVTHIGSYGIEIAGSSHDIAVRRCDLVDLGGGGVKVWHSFAGTAAVPGAGPDWNHTGTCRRVIISDNEIADGGHRYHQAVGVLIGRCTGVQLVHNHIHDFDYSGVSVGWTWGYQDGEAYGNLVEYNHIHHIGRGMLSDMGAIYTLGVQPGTRLRYNVIHDVESRGYGGWGIYNDEGSSYILIENNLVYGAKSSPYVQHYGRDNLVQNNIFAFGREAQFSRGRVEPHNSFTFARNILLFNTDGNVLAGSWAELGATIDHNLYCNLSGAPLTFAGLSWEAWQARGADQHSLIADPGFADPAHGDFALAADSLAWQIGFVPFDLSSVGPRR